MRLYHARRGGLRAPVTGQRHPRAHRADAACAVRLVLRDGRGRLALRNAGDERDRALRRAHVLQGHRAPPDLARDLERDRRDRRRVQRVHRQGVHGLLRQVRRRHPRHRPRRARRHAPQLDVRRRRDRAREGRDRRGDEHVLRHAARLHRRGVRGAPLRRPAARLAHHRPQGDRPRGDARDVRGLPRPLVPPRADGRRARRQDRRRPACPSSRSCSATSGRATPRRRRRLRRRPTATGPRVRVHHKVVRPGAPRARRAEHPARPSRPLRVDAARHGARRRHVVAPLHRGARAARPRLLRLRGQPQLHRRRLALLAGRRRHRADRPGDRDDRRRASRHGRQGGPRRRAREGAPLRQGPLRAPAREPARDDHVRDPARGARGAGARSRLRCSPGSTPSPPRTCSASRSS